jgi:hypothetical protein
MNFRLLNRADWQRVRDYCSHLPWTREDGTQIVYKVSVDEIKSTRSLEQNAFYWTMLTAISQQAVDHLGGEFHSPQVWHAYLAGRFLGVEPGPYGTGVRRSTAGLKVGEFSDYLHEVEAFARTQFAGFHFEWEDVA